MVNWRWYLVVSHLRCLALALGAIVVVDATLREEMVPDVTAVVETMVQVMVVTVDATRHLPQMDSN